MNFKELTTYTFQQLKLATQKLELTKMCRANPP